MFFFVFLTTEDVHFHLPAQLSSLHPPVRAHVQGVPPVHGAAETWGSSGRQGEHSTVLSQSEK